VKEAEMEKLIHVCMYKYREIYSGDKIKKNELGGAHCMDDGWKRCVDFGGETCSRET
jgi:hypothetical protein